LPVIVSDLTGCSIDLVKEGVNGYRFKTGNIDELASRLSSILYDHQLTMEITSENVVDIYSYNTIAKNLLSLTNNSKKSL
jgi:glycosyltransferase involved in cell wall biosynthesis